jgi:hypothetical protein
VKEIVKDKRLLRRMNSAGYVQWPATNDPADAGHPYVRQTEGMSSEFTMCGQKYVVEYLDGCFYPFVFELKP